ncbi:serine aminopeptidase domain-containing protein [Chamaesiphon sp. VAR_48_metabat_135_sub]|uniref:alpha/beta hydrolase n=1 Tax=Chamaesiphon sp. VAR_48_metabat_135_sub TaxID=2964699 RepID=UPI00286ACB6F|nr:alpha/beta hydrolase [Chamaesiphon sp. VAR_48_metabat_135_sub]
MLRDWNEYYHEHFSNYKQKSDVRNGCYPQMFKHDDDGQPRNAIVLVHGLTDSPYFMKDIGEYFCSEMGFDVYIPLLRAHGLKEPEDMKDASLIEWRKDVIFAIEKAKESGGKVSIGGLSTGGTLSVKMALTDEQSIDGGVFLFSAALGLASGAGNLAEIFLRTTLAKILDYLDSYIDRSRLINNSASGNPFRYSKMDIGGARELSKLIKELDLLTDRDILNQPLFAAHSEADTTAAIDEIEELVDRSYQRHQKAEMFRIGKNFGVPHASIVLKDPVLSLNNSPLEPKNIFFESMMESLRVFADRYGLIDRIKSTRSTD